VRRERRGSFFSLFSFFFFISSFNSPTGSKGRYSVPLATTLVIASTGEIHQTCISGFFNQGENKIPTSDIVRETAEERVAERILAEFLDNCAAIGIRVGLQQLLRRRVGETLQEYWV
jgi:hypothetical protein